MASLYDIHVRTGCFCNTGACQSFLGITNEQMRKNLQVRETVIGKKSESIKSIFMWKKCCVFRFKAGHVCGDRVDTVDGQPTGSVRVSFGYMSTFEDCEKFLRFVAECFVEKPVTVDQVRLQKLISASAASQCSPEDPPINITNGGTLGAEERAEPTDASPRRSGQRESKTQWEAYTLTNIYIYPIKSCGAFEVVEQPIWCIVYLDLSLYSFTVCPVSFPSLMLGFRSVLFVMQVHDWPLGPLGLLYDRSWMVVNGNGVNLGQKREPRLCLVRPQVHLPSNKLLLRAPGQRLSRIKNKYKIKLLQPKTSQSDGCSAITFLC